MPKKIFNNLIEINQNNLHRILTKIHLKLIYSPIFELIVNPINRVFYSKHYIRRFDKIKSFPQEKRRISVAITHYERPDLLIVTLKNIFRDERVSEIVILDDGSSLESFLKSSNNLKDFGSKVRLFRREQNLGPYATKVQASSLCSSSWCILLDSDNTIFDSYLNAIFNLETWDRSTIYCPEYAFPHYNFKSYANSIVNFNDICHSQNSSRILINNYIFSCLISGGNYFVNTKLFTTVLQPYLILRPYATDTFMANYIWLSQGNKLKVIPNSSYYHRIHSQSTWILNSHQGIVEYNVIAKKFEEQQRATVEDLLLDFESVDAINNNIEYIPLRINHNKDEY